MNTSSEAAAMWGSAENHAYPAEQRLAMALKALGFFGNAYDRVEKTLARIEQMDCTQPGAYGTASRDAVAVIRKAMQG